MRTTGVDRFLARARSTQSPFYQEFPPAQDLRPFVACTWIRRVRHAGGEAVDAILPDGCSDIMVYDDQPPAVAGPDAITRTVHLPDGLVIVGIRLRPGACRAVFGCSAERLVNGSLLLSDVGSGAAELHRRLRSSDRLDSRLALLENWVRTAVTRAMATDRAVVAACRWLGANTTVDVGEAARRLDWNPRTLHRQFLAACGYGPKHFQRIMRLQQALRAANVAPVLHLSALAAASGYADQAHMTRDFRALTGFTPTAYFADAAPPGWGAWLDAGW